MPLHPPAYIVYCSHHHVAQAKISGYSPADGRYQARLDSCSSEWLAMEQRRFAWLTPRGRSAGYCALLHGVMLQLGASNVPVTPQVCASSCASVSCAELLCNVFAARRQLCAHHAASRFGESAFPEFTSDLERHCAAA